MIILGLGSNLADRLGNLRRALHLIQEIPGLTVQQVSPVYLSDALLPDNAPTQWDRAYLNVALRCQSTLPPHALLEHLKRIEIAMGRHTPYERWSPRLIDIDILAVENVSIESHSLTLPQKNLLNRPFALWPFADVAPTFMLGDKTVAELVEPLGSRFAGQAPFHTRQIFQRIDMPELVGIINATPDSFADGGQFESADAALQQAIHLVNSGATILDIGAESTSPRAVAISAQEEWTRLEPILKTLHTNKHLFFITPKISIDTRHATVAAQALAYDIDWVNDVTGLDDPAMRDVLAGSQTDCVFMHHLAIPERRDCVLPRHKNAADLVYAWGEERLQLLTKQGIARERLIFDPGIGFGKMAEQSLALLQQVAIFSKLGVRVLIGHSRKTFLSTFTDLPFAERDIETTAISLYLAKQPVDYIRLHNVECAARSFRVAATV